MSAKKKVVFKFDERSYEAVPSEQPSGSELRCTDLLGIPEGYFVHHCDLDADEPYCVVAHRDKCTGPDQKLLIAKPLAYYLKTHFCGSKTMHDLITENERRRIGNVLKELMGLDA